MDNIRISLCIPTKNRFDNFLNKYLDDYLDYLKRGIINEIVITDETGDDYEKIKNKYQDYLDKNNDFKIYKNTRILGVFVNKHKVSCLATNDLVALIDSDNFVDDNYFLRVRKFISENKLPEHYIISPDFAAPNFDFSHLGGLTVTKNNIKEHYDKYHFGTLLNTGNYVFTKSIMTNLKYDSSPERLFKITSCDVIYYNLLFFQQYEDLIFYSLKGHSYTHVVHSDSEYIKTIQNQDNFNRDFIDPEYRKFF